MDQKPPKLSDPACTSAFTTSKESVAHALQTPAADSIIELASMANGEISPEPRGVIPVLAVYVIVHW
jgi:hypothetical protein